MQTKVLVGSLVVAVLAVGAYYVYTQGSARSRVSDPVPVSVTKVFDPKNATYTVDGASVTLVHGVASVPAAPGSASSVTTRYFGNDATGDLAGRGGNDKAFLITQDSGGSGLFYYVVAALDTSSGYTVTNAVLLGDRIAPQSTEIRDGKVLVNFAERKKGEPMTAQPSVGVTKTFSVTASGTLVDMAP